MVVGEELLSTCREVVLEAEWDTSKTESALVRLARDILNNGSSTDIDTREPLLVEFRQVAHGLRRIEDAIKLVGARLERLK